MMRPRCLCRDRERRLRRTGTSLAMVALVWWGTPLATAQTFDWNAPASGSWFVGTNWTPNAIPSTTTSTARIGGTTPLSVVVDTSNALVGTLDLANPNAILRVASGRQLQVETGAAVNGTLEIGDGTASGFTALRFGTFAGFTGSGRVVLRGPGADPSRAQLVAGAGGAAWPKTLAVNGTGRVAGNHFVVGTVRADDPFGGVLEFNSGLVNGLGTGEFVADGGTLRVFQSRFFDATLRAINSGVIEFSAPVATGTASPYLSNNCIVRGPTRFLRNVTYFDKTDLDSDVELRSGASLAFKSYGAATKIRAVVNSQGVAPASSLSLCAGTPSGGGSITLNATVQRDDAVVYGGDVVLGPEWTIQGQGLIRGSFTLNSKVVADRTAGPPLGFYEAVIGGSGSLEARGGNLWFGEATRLTGLSVQVDSGSVALIETGARIYNSTWTNVTATGPIEHRKGELVLDSCTINGDLLLEGPDSIRRAYVVLSGPSASVHGNITIRNGGIIGDEGTPLLGGGVIRLDYARFLDDAILNLRGVWLEDAWTIRGAGIVGYNAQLRAPIHVDDPSGRQLMLSGPVTGDGAASISISSGELVIDKASTIKNFHVTGTPGCKPVRVGLDDFYPYGDYTTQLQFMAFDVPAWVGQYRTRIRGSSFNSGLQVRGGTNLFFETESRSTVNGDLTLVPLADPNLPCISGLPPTGNWRAVFRNTVTGVSAGVVALSDGGLLEAGVAGTGRVYSLARFGGNIDPSDESGAGGAGLIYFDSSELAFLPQASVDIDLLDTRRYDRVSVLGTVIVNGTLRVHAPPNFYPPPAFDFLVIRGNCMGAFSSVEAPPGFRAEMRYNFMGASVRLVKRCGSDFDQSGAVDESDFEVFAAAYSLMDCADPLMQAQCPADLDRDRFVDDADFSMFAVAFDRAICD